MGPAEEHLLEQREVRRRTPTGTSETGRTYGLPAEVVETAVRRLGFLGLVIGVMFPAVYCVEYFTQRARTAGPIPPGVAVVFFVTGVVICILAWSKKFDPQLVLDIGLIFEVIVAFGISLDENIPLWPADQMLRGVSWNCLWITMYVVAIPGTMGKTVLAAITAAFMGPFGLLVDSVIERSIPAQPQILNQILPFVAAGWAIPVARHFYHLGTQVTRARAMGSYELLELIGQGGMGEVWTARHRMLKRVSAIKLISPDALAAGGADTKLLLHRFEREARTTAALRSPHTVALYDYGTAENGSFYYVMELLDGVDLETLVRRFGPVPAGRAVWFLTQAAKSLAEAHALGLVHRDIKPRNLFVCRMGMEFDFTKVLDFGLVKITDLETQQTCLTREGVTTGTPAYMAPEVAMGKPDIDGRADLYSLGCLGYWLLTGQLVFEADTAVATVLAHVQDKPVPPSQRTEIEVSKRLDHVILRCLEKNPADRPESAHELIDLLAACDDVDPWTQKQAEEWWSTHLPKISDRAAFAAGAGDNTV
ncbi:MAG: serine/threonine-protein kinase [Bryobacteraceae bacterium]